MIDPTSFGTAITALGVVTTMVIAFGLAILADMALRRSEDRASASTLDAAHEDGSASGRAPGRTRVLVADVPEGGAAANGSTTD